MTDNRPTPEQMLARVRSEANVKSRVAEQGKLKLFLGYAAGVGKTFAMLQAARALAAERRDVVVGYVEPHGRAETEALLEGLETLPAARVEYRGTRLAEFDLEAALARRPEFILVDELAHTNAAGSRHSKRWQDVEELLAAGIDVYSTMNVQHVESLNDVIAQISGIVVRETVPDGVLQQADEVVLVDLPPDELLERLKQGKVYVPQQAAQALERFFRKPNLVALREIALREAAQRAHREVEQARQATAAEVPWATNERLLVCVGPSPTSAKVVRAAKRLADRLGGTWMAVHVSPADAPVNDQNEDLVHRNLMLAESLGGETTRLVGEDVAETLLDYAQRRNVTKIVLGKSEPGRFRWLRRSSGFTDRLIDHSGEIDVVVVRGVHEPLAEPSVEAIGGTSGKSWLETCAALGAASLLAYLCHRQGFSEANLVMIYLLAVVFAAVRGGRTPGIAASIVAVLLFDILFTKPYYWISVQDSQYLVTFAVMLVVGLSASALATRVRRQADAAQANERRTEALYRLTRRLAGLADLKSVVREVEDAIGEILGAYAVVFLPNHRGKLLPAIEDLHQFAASAAEFAAAQWVFDNGQAAGAGTNTLPLARANYLPLQAPSRTVGVLAVSPDENGRQLTIDDQRLLESLASQVAVAIERGSLAEEASQALVAAENEKLRSSLLSAVSHDIRTPLAGIAGASSTLATAFDAMDPETRRELLRSITVEAERLTHLVENLLHMTRLAGDKVKIARQWHPLEDIIGSALNRLESSLVDRPVATNIDQRIPLVNVDGILIEQMLVNLTENAVKYSPSGSPVTISATIVSGGFELSVENEGAGFAPGEATHVFDMFYRGTTGSPDQKGSGIGLAICRAVCEVHGGSIRARNRESGGACVTAFFPFVGDAPAVSEDAIQDAVR